MRDLLDYLHRSEQQMLRMLEGLVNIDSGTYCRAGVNACGQIIAGELQKLGFKTETLEEQDFGNHIRAERDGKGKNKVFLSAHLDTVFTEGAVAANPFRIEGAYAYGPGVGDMKGGIVLMLYALKALQEIRYSPPPISIFLTADEEIGSVRGRPHIEAIAKECSHVLVMEPCSSLDSIAVRRWGIGSFYLTIHGKAAHVLKPDTEGINACRELAFKILALESLTDTQRGVKVSVNLVNGGRSRQVTAATARADIDVRIRNSALMAEVEAKVRQVAGTPVLPGIRIDLEGKLTRPPMEPHPETEAFLQLANDVASEIGFNLQGVEEYGGSDGCLTAPLGVATLDAMGPVCYDMCGDNEHIEVASLVPRTALLAGIMQKLADT
jgi:glutamate carboxypeptidase